MIFFPQLIIRKARHIPEFSVDLVSFGLGVNCFLFSIEKVLAQFHELLIK